MRVIVEYRNTGIIRVVDTSVRVVVNPLPPRPKVNIVTNLQSAPNIGPESEWKDSTGCEYKTWKRQEKHARKNWMRHPHRTENTPSARILNPLYS